VAATEVTATDVGGVEARIPMSDGNRSDQVTLGCGSLILIALIVIIFSGSGDKEVAKDVKELRSEVQSLKTEIQGLKQSVDDLKSQAGPRIRPIESP
jgi:hypothetical protein